MTRFPWPRRKPRGTIRATRNGPRSSLNPSGDLYCIRYPSISSTKPITNKGHRAQVYSEQHSQPTHWGHATRDPLQGPARGLAPFDPPIREAVGRSIMSAGRKVWVKIRASEAERAEWHGKARAVGLSLSDPPWAGTRGAGAGLWPQPLVWSLLGSRDGMVQQRESQGGDGTGVERARCPDLHARVAPGRCAAARPGTVIG